jgi:hypothetical protein
MLTCITVERQKLYVGSEPELWTRSLTLPVGGVSISLREIDDNHLDTLKPQIGETAFQQVVADGGFVETDIGTFADADGLSLLYLLRDDTLFVLGMTETNPGRYRVMFEGAWRIA